MHGEAAAENGDQQVENEEIEEEHQAPPEEAMEAAENLVALNVKDVVDSAVEYLVAQEENEQESVSVFEQADKGVKISWIRFYDFCNVFIFCFSGDSASCCCPREAGRGEFCGPGSHSSHACSAAGQIHADHPRLE